MLPEGTNLPDDPTIILEGNIEEQYAPLFARHRKLMETAALHPAKLDDIDMAFECADLIGKFAALIAEANRFRAIEKRPYLKPSQKIDSAFHDLTSRGRGPRRDGQTLREAKGWLEEILAAFQSDHPELAKEFRTGLDAHAKLRFEAKIRIHNLNLLDLEALRPYFKPEATLQDTLDAWLEDNPNAERGHDALAGAFVWNAPMTRVTTRRKPR